MCDKQFRFFFEILNKNIINKLSITILKNIGWGGGGKNYPVRSSTSDKYDYFLKNIHIFFLLKYIPKRSKLLCFYVNSYRTCSEARTTCSTQNVHLKINNFKTKSDQNKH